MPAVTKGKRRLMGDINVVPYIDVMLVLLIIFMITAPLLTQGIKVEYQLGTMIEIPRAAITADKVAETAEFFSFGTNDLTQTTFGLSRDDVPKVLASYLDKEVYKVDPFVSIDREGVGYLMKHAVIAGRKTRKDLKCGICGEHGGDPSSVEFCDSIGLNYVSCSPYRLPIARLAAAQAVLKK